MAHMHVLCCVLAIPQETMRTMLPGLVVVCKRLMEHDESEGIKAMEFFDEVMDSSIKLVRGSRRGAVHYCIISGIGCIRRHGCRACWVV